MRSIFRGRLLRLVLPVSIATLVSSCGGIRWGLPEPATTQGAALDAAWQTFAIAGLIVGGLVFMLILFAAFRYRRRSDVEPSQTQYHIPLEIIYTAIPILIVAFLFFVSLRGANTSDALTSTPDVVVEVTGFQWDWQFDYPAYGVSVVGTPDAQPVMVVPVNETTRLVLRSTDVVHSFWVPDFLYKRDLIPGTTQEVDVTPTKTGTFVGRCAEFCGLLHYAMDFEVQVVSRQEFDQWIAQHGGRP